MAPAAARQTLLATRCAAAPGSRKLRYATARRRVPGLRAIPRLGCRRSPEGRLSRSPRANEDAQKRDLLLLSPLRVRGVQPSLPGLASLRGTSFVPRPVPAEAFPGRGREVPASRAFRRAFPANPHGFISRFPTVWARIGHRRTGRRAEQGSQPIVEATPRAPPTTPFRSGSGSRRHTLRVDRRRARRT